MIEQYLYGRPTLIDTARASERTSDDEISPIFKLFETALSHPDACKSIMSALVVALVAFAASVPLLPSAGIGALFGCASFAFFKLKNFFGPNAESHEKIDAFAPKTT